MSGLNWKMIKSNLIEARQELEKIESRIESGDLPHEGDLQVMVEHVFHHLNFAWNARRFSMKRYSELTDEDFNLFGKFPEDIEEFRVSQKVDPSHKFKE